MIEELFCINYTDFDSNTHSVDVGDKVTNEMGLIYHTTKEETMFNDTTS